MDARLQTRIQRYGWDLASDDYEPAWAAQLAGVQAGLLAAAALAPGERVLDVACGSGQVTLQAAEAVGAQAVVLGTDLSQRMVDSARQRAAQRSIPNVAFARMGAERLALPDAEFDVVLCSLGLMYVPDPARAVREMRRVLRPGGVLMVCTPYDWNAGATRMEAWLGGHSKRAHGAGDPSRVLEMLLTPGANPASLASTRLVASRHDVPWNVRVHDRHAAAYTLHAVVARAE